MMGMMLCGQKAAAGDVRLLLHFDALNGNVPIDSSSYSLPITVTGQPFYDGVLYGHTPIAGANCFYAQSSSPFAEFKTSYTIPRPSLDRPVSFEFYFKPTFGYTSAVYCSDVNNNELFGFDLEYSSETDKFNIVIYYPSYTTITCNMNLNEWHYIKLVRDNASNWSLYVNNILKHTYYFEPDGVLNPLRVWGLFKTCVIDEMTLKYL